MNAEHCFDGCSVCDFYCATEKRDATFKAVIAMLEGKDTNDPTTEQAIPGEAHWIKKYTPDDGEIYECDNCGVTWQFTDGGPEENEAFYCPKCGFKMVPKGE